MFGSSHGFVTIAILLCVVVVPMWLRLHYRSRMSAAHHLSEASARTLAELATLADRMTARIENLERALDAAPRDGRQQ
ncbi:MAG TPA: envelope stress response membrane protein PspB [Stellaceae bacterium]|nr:envelope stress response membrane protein PspB [Stellaceae bacterium]